MNGSDEAFDQDTVQIDDFPTGIGSGTTILIAGTVDPTTHALGLRALHQFSDPEDAAVLVTTTESADRTLATYDAMQTDSEQQSLGIVDTTSEQQYITALYDETPVVFVPSPGDLERLVLALSDIEGNRLQSGGTRHLVFRSLTPVLQNAPVRRVRSMLDRISGLRTGNGLTVLGVDYTAHDEETMTALTDAVDGVLWVTLTAGDQLEFEFQPARGHHGSPRPSLN